MAELSESIIKWINELPDSDQKILSDLDMEMEMSLLIDLLKEGRDLKRLRELYRKLANNLDKEDQVE